jgi:hypothetical protein
MITNIRVVDPTPNPGMEITAEPFSMKNFRMHKMVSELSRQLMSILESDSNNSSAQVVPAEIREIWYTIAAVEAEFGYLKTYRDDPTGILEQQYSILLPVHSEVMRMKNRPLQCVAQEMLRFANIVVFNDSSQQQNNLGLGPQEQIEQALSTMKTIIADTIGDGSKKEDGSYNVGRRFADVSRLGTLAPDIDLNKVTRSEPRVGAVVPPNVPDAPDVPSDLP